MERTLSLLGEGREPIDLVESPLVRISPPERESLVPSGGAWPRVCLPGSSCRVRGPLRPANAAQNAAHAPDRRQHRKRKPRLSGAFSCGRCVARTRDLLLVRSGGTVVVACDLLQASGLHGTQVDLYCG